jgi:Uma2 family endonuclease
VSIATNFTLRQYERMVESGAFDGENHERVEFVRGEIRKMSPIGYRHCLVVDLLARWSIEGLSSDRAVVRIQGSVQIPSLSSQPEPDILWLTPKLYSKGHPTADDILLAMEVAESSIAYDTGEKAQLYAEAGVADYWVFNLVDDCVEVYRQPQATGYKSLTTYRDDEEICPLAFDDVTLTPATVLRAGEEQK